MIGVGKTYSKYWLIVLISCSFIYQRCDTESNLDPDYKNYYVRFFGDEGLQEGVDLIVNEDDQSVILLGTSTEPGSPNNKRIFLVKADWEGNLIWKRKLGGPYDIAKDIERSNDGGFIILSESSEDVQLSEGLGVKLIKVTPDGDKTDSTTFNSPSEGTNHPNDHPATVTPITDGYIVTGSTQYQTQWASDGPDVSDFMTILFTESLDLDPGFDRYLSKSDNDHGFKTVEIGQTFYTFSSSQYLPQPEYSGYNFLCYSTTRVGIPGNEFLIGKGQSGDEILSSICPSFTSGYFMAGTHSSGTNVSNIYIGFSIEDGDILKEVSETGKIITIPQSSGHKIVTNSVCQAKADPQGYLILGTEGEVGARNLWLCKVSDIGDKVYWSSIFGSGDRNDDRAGAVAELPDGRILVVGTVNLGVNNLKMSLFKLNSRGEFAN